MFVDAPVFTSRLGALPLTSQSNLTSFAIADTITMLEGRLQLMGGARHQRVDVASYRNGVKTAYDKSALTPGVGIVFKPVAADGRWHLQGRLLRGRDTAELRPALASR